MDRFHCTYYVHVYLFCLSEFVFLKKYTYLWEIPKANIFASRSATTVICTQSNLMHIMRLQGLETTSHFINCIIYSSTLQSKQQIEVHVFIFKFFFPAKISLQIFQIFSQTSKKTFVTPTIPTTLATIDTRINIAIPCKQQHQQNYDNTMGNHKQQHRKVYMIL